MKTKINFLGFLFFASMNSYALAELSAKDAAILLEGTALVGISAYTGVKTVNYYFANDIKPNNLKELVVSPKVIEQDIKVLCGLALTYLVFKRAINILTAIK